MSTCNEEPLEGGFNTNIFLVTNEGKSLLERVPKQNRDLFENIVFEFRAIGFTGDGGRVRRRTLNEQAVFSQRAAINNLNVLPLVQHQNKWAMPYVKDIVTIDQYLRDEEIPENLKSKVVADAVFDIERAHDRNIVYGDRWAGNMAVVNDTILQLDFDLELSGRYAKEVDLAQALYHLIWSDKDRASLLILTKLVAKGFAHHDINHLMKYLRGFSSFLDDTDVGGISEVVEEFIHDVYTMRKNRSHGATLLTHGGIHF